MVIDLAEPLIGAVRLLLLTAALLTPLEVLWPAVEGQRLLRRGLGMDLALALLMPITGRALGGAAVLGLWSVAEAPLAGLHGAFATLPLAVELLVAVVLSDLAVYGAHRLSHTVPALWRLHRLHHSSESLDWLSGARQHPLEVAWHMVAANLPVVLLGLPVESVLGWVLLQRLHTAFVHANVNIPPGPWDRLVGGPRFHRWHHSAEAANLNYASLLPVWDLLFGSFHLPAGAPARVGLELPVALSPRS